MKYAAKNYGRGGFIADMCMIPYTIGDIVSSWPNPGYEKFGLDVETIRGKQADCVWKGGS
jgi:hypothetical protein